MLIRPLQPETDLQKVVDLVNRFEPEPLSLAAVRRWFERQQPGRRVHAIVATDAQQDVIGYGEVFHEAWFPEGQYQLWVITHPTVRCQGIGTALYNEAQRIIAGETVACLLSETRENCPAGLHFAQKRGFQIDRRQFESTLDLTGFEESPFLPQIAPVAAAGIRIASLADFGDSQPARKKLYEVNYAAALDIPGVTEWMSFDDFESAICGADWYRPEGQLAAIDGEAFVGIAAVKLVAQTHGSYNLVTGVLRDYRRRKIALALKLAAIRYARLNGAEYIRTNNDSLNPAILALNTKLGYQPQPGKLILKCAGQSELKS